MDKRWLMAGTALGAAALIGGAYHYLLRRPLARTRGTLRLPGLHRPVEILRDRWGVPHIYAADRHDLFFAQGFVHAQDRLWQMDFQRRMVAGRLSEVLGPQTVAVDRWLRILGMRRLAEQQVSLLTEPVRTVLEAYAAGVNARIALGRLPVEFGLLRYRPEPWTAADTLAWNKAMSWGLSINWESELLRAQLIARLGPERAAELEPELDELSIVPPGGLSALDRAAAARPFLGPPPQAGVGSNSWVLAGQRTVGGTPILANDMHLPMYQPSIWYENHLVGGGLNVIGITFPGVPGVVAGHNGHVAWGFTNGFPDVQDLYRERLRRDEAGRVWYEYRGEWHRAEIIREEIEVKGAETVVEEVILTRHGPIINALAADLAGEEPLALRWTSWEPDTVIHAVLEMMEARTCLEFRQALRRWTSPVQNVVYADREGNIAYSLAGRVPIRAKGEGLTPVPGWTGEYEWTGYIPFEEMPHLYNPPQGYIVTANNRIVGKEYPYFLGREYASDDRARRITELIEGRKRVDVAYVRKMHFDLVSPTARDVARHLGNLRVQDPRLAAVVEMMGRWDGALTADSPEAAVYQVFLRRMIRLLLVDRLGEDLTVRYAGLGPTPQLADRSIFGVRARQWLHKLLEEPDSPWFDLGNGEGRDEAMILALQQTVAFLEQELGPEPKDWAWGKLHTLTYAHTLGRLRPLDLLFNRGPYPLGGDDTTVWATGAARHDLSCERIIGPPYRFIADLGDLDHALGLLAPGQSGQPGSKHYDDQIRAWFEGGYHPLLYAREDVEREMEAKLRLLPLTEQNP